MKTKIYIIIMQALLFAGQAANAQNQYAGNRGNDNAKVVVNNYYDNYDYFYASSINRFHSSYSAFRLLCASIHRCILVQYQPFSWG